MRTMRLAIAAVMLASTAGQAQATMLLTTGAETQIETWLGQGNLSFNELFSKVPGATSFNWHTAVDGQGPSVTLIEVLRAPGFGVATSQVIGFYNPTNWSSLSAYSYSIDPSDRKAFLFNLTTMVKLNQKSDGYGVYQSYNHSYYGPVAGGGFDLYIGNNLMSGGAYTYSYGVGFATNNVVGPTYGGGSLTIGRLETYTFSPANISTPEPTSMALAGFAGMGMAIGAWQRRRQQPATKRSQTAA